MNTINLQHRYYLESLRDSGRVNMFGASIYLEREFGLSKNEARDVLLNWMQSFKKETQNA